MIYTGGTTGNPKGVVLSVDAVNWNALNTIVSWGLTEEDRTINYMPLFHTGGLNALSIPILMAGGMVIVGSRFDAEEALHGDRSVRSDHFTICSDDVSVDDSRSPILTNRPFLP